MFPFASISFLNHESVQSCIDSSGPAIPFLPGTSRLTTHGYPTKVRSLQDAMSDHDNNSLYTEALEAAEREATELDQEIAQLKTLLRRLEAQKSAVDEVYLALSKWVELSGTQPEPTADPFDSLFEDQGETIRLSEEEVSLIAYPDGRPPEEESH